MQHETVSQMFQRYHADKKNGVKHTPLHTLQECCEEAGIDPRLFGRYAAQYPGVPQPVLNHSKNVGRGAVKYYRKHEIVQWINQVRQQKEKAMPDIKTALQQALAKTANSWAADDEAHQKIAPTHNPTPTPTPAPKEITMTATTAPATASTIETQATPAPANTNLSRATFELIRDNPGVVMLDVMNALGDKGFRPKSVASLIYQMIKVRLVVADPNGKLTAVVREYVPIQTSLRRATKPKAVAKPAAPAPTPRKHIEITNTRTGEVISTAPKQEWTVESVVDKLNVRQAMAVYEELRKIFGE